MAYTKDLSITRSNVLGGQERPFSDYQLSEGSLKLYDKNARSVSAMLIGERSHLYNALLRSETSGYTLVKTLVKQPADLEILRMLQQDVILALDEDRGMLLYSYGNGDLVMYAIIQRLEERIRIAGFQTQVGGELRSFLKNCYKGWHHMFHEVIATAPGFIAAPVYDTKIDELIQLIQVPPQFPV